MATQICRVCGKEKDILEFSMRNEEKRHTECKQCHKEYTHKWYLEHKIHHNKIVRKWDIFYREEIEKKLSEYLLNHPCVVCDEKDILVLEFDHINGKKDFNIGDRLHHKHSWETLFKEIQKCQVLCANCHKRKTARQLNSWRLKYALS